MKNISSTYGLASALKWAALAAMVLTVVAVIYALATATLTASAFQEAYPAVAVAPELKTWQMALVLSVGLLPMLAWVWTLNKMRQLFACFEKGQTVSLKSAEFIQSIGLGLLGIAIIQIVSVPVNTLLLTLANPTGGRSIAIGLDSAMIGFLLAAGLMTVIGSAMRDASQIAEENRAFV